MKKCRVCKEKTKDYKKINNMKIYLCTDGCKITYVLRRFLDKNYNYNNHYGYVSLSIN
jgi:spore coat polysaccharide biosynthesis protein SpsF (cytidylyltransferase family)